MEHNEIRALLEKYWLAETTVEEEKALASYFHGAEVAADLETFRPLFDWIGEETQVTPGPDFENRILERITALPVGNTIAVHNMTSVDNTTPVRSFHFGYSAAAAIILCVISLFLVIRIPTTTKTGLKTTVPMTIKDTYDNPEQALAAVRRALLVASVHMNEGKQITQDKMSRLNKTWKTAVGN